MRPITLAVISDLHFGRHARSKDICPHTDGGPSVDEKYRDKFLAFLKHERIAADYLILPGDVSEIAHIDEIELASRFIKQVADLLGITEDKVIFVPGNHDVDWSVLTVPLHRIGWNRRFDPIKDTQSIFLRSSGTGDLYNPSFVSSWSFPNLAVVGYNSSWNDKRGELVNHGFLDRDHLPHLEATLAAASQDSTVARLFLVHHHPLSYSTPVPGPPDFSQMVNAEELFRLLRRYYFDLVIHGHTHQPRFQTVQQDGSIPIAVLAAGSFSLQLPTEWVGKVNNQFHLLCIDDRDPGTNYLRGRVESWTYYFGHGWRESTSDKEGIAHTEPFGLYQSQHDCRAALKTLLDSLFATRDWLERSHLINADPGLKYLRPERLVQALDELASEMNFRLHDRYSDRLVILKD